MWHWSGEVALGLVAASVVMGSMVLLQRARSDARAFELRAIEDSEARLAGIIDSASDAIITVDVDHCILLFNRTAERLFGMPAVDAHGRRIDALLPDGAYARLLEMLAADGSAPAGSAPAGHGHQEDGYQLVGCDRSGNQFVAEARASLAVAAGRQLTTILLRDVTQQRRTDEALARSRWLQDTLLNSLPDLAFLKDRDSRFLAVNEATSRAFGLAPDAMIGRTDDEFVPREMAARYRADDAAVLASGERLIVEEPWVAADGTQHWIETIKTPYRDASGEFAGIVGVSRDVSERRRVADALRVSEARYQRIAANIPGMVYQLVLRPDGTIVLPFVSDGCRDLLQATPDDLRTTPSILLDAVHPADRAAFRASMEASANGLTAWRWEGRIVHPGGECRWAANASRPERQPDGSTLWDGLLVDATERHRTAEALVQQTEILQSVMDHMGEAVVVVDEAQQYVISNPAADDVLDALMPTQIAAEPWGLYGADGVTPIGTCDSPLARASRGEHVDDVEVLVRSPGSPDGRWLHVNGRPVHDQSGRHRGGVLVCRDVTERKQGEKSLRLQALTFESIHDGVVLTDGEGRILDWNPAAERIFGHARSEAIGQVSAILQRPEDAADFAVRVAECMRAGTRWTGEIPTLRRNGRDARCEVTVVPFDVPGGQGARIEVYRDVTHKRELERQLLQAQKLEAIGQLAAGIAHEINTPAQYVGDNVRFLEDGFTHVMRVLDAHEGMLASARETGVLPLYVAATERAIASSDLAYLRAEIPVAIVEALEGLGRISEIISAVKGFSHPGSQEHVAVNLSQQVEHTIAVSRNEWKYIADVVTEFDDALPLVPCLAGEMNQVILNLIVNAAHAIADADPSGVVRGVITITTRRMTEWAEIRVRDTGAGIPEEVRERIFEPFFTTKEVGRGTGQGLAIAHSVVVEKHGGSLSFETEMGTGTTFVVRIPLQRATQSQRAA